MFAISSRDLKGIITLVIIFAILAFIIILIVNYRSMKYEEDRVSFTFSSLLKKPVRIYFKDIKRAKLTYSRYGDAYLKINTFYNQTLYLRMNSFHMDNLKTYIEWNAEANLNKTMRWANLYEQRMELPTVVFIGSKNLAQVGRLVGHNTFSLLLVEDINEFVSLINQHISSRHWSRYLGKYEKNTDDKGYSLNVFEKIDTPSIISLEYSDKLKKTLIGFSPDWIEAIRSHPYLYIE